MRAAWINVFLLGCLPVAAAPWQEPAEHADVRLTLATRGDRTTFRIGEVIPVELKFTCACSKKYQLDMALYDRSGRLGSETWAVEPQAGWDDPLRVYFSSFNGFIGGGLRGIGVLSDKPETIRLELNEWVRFKQPGQYRVTVTSSRVSKLDVQFGSAGMSVSSNELRLTIIAASPEWQVRTLQRALALIDGPSHPAVPLGQPDPHREAVKALRYLGTEAAARAMACRLTDSVDGSEYRFGLVGSPAQEAALEEMKTLLAAPDVPVTNQFLTTISVLALPGGDTGLPAAREELENHFRQDLIAALAAKQGEALAVSANSIVDEAAMRGRELPPDLKRKLTEQLVANFDKLSVAAQDNLIEYRMRALDREAMLPLLRKVAQRYEDFPELREMHAFQFNNASAGALRQWYEADPTGARPAIVLEILRPRPRFNAAVLGLLPDKELPEADQSLVENFRQSKDLEGSGNLASLIHRYASAAVAGQVAGYLDEHLGKFACAIQDPLLACLVKQDPGGARPRLETAMAARGEGHSACNRYLLAEVGKLQTGPVLQEIAVASLVDPDPQVVAGAAAYLKNYGPADAEEVLWSRFAAWSQRWKGSEARFRYMPGENMDGVYEAGAGTNMMEALATAQGWVTSEAKLRRLIELSVGPQQKQQAEGYLEAWQKKPWTIQFIGTGEGQFDIAQYHAISLQAAKDKLLQFPRGTSFHWPPGAQAGEENAARELSRFAAEHGIEVIRKP